VSEYQPGTCNIGRNERKKRRVAGTLSFLVAVGYVAFVVATGRPDTLLLGSFPFLFGGFIGVVQDRMGFCVAFGALARYDLSGSGGDAGQVTNEEALKRDRIRAFQVFAIAAGLSVVTTLVVYGVGTAV
jgi:hypothetical protein